MTVSNTGEVVIKFSDEFLVPDNVTEIDSTVLDVKLIQWTSVEPSLLGFKWSTTEFTSDSVKL